MTPSQHKTAAEALLTTIEASPMTADDHARARAHAHAVMSHAAGIGSHYATADALLATEATATVRQARNVVVAAVHAALADQ